MKKKKIDGKTYYWAVSANGKKIKVDSNYKYLITKDIEYTYSNIDKERRGIDFNMSIAYLILDHAGHLKAYDYFRSSLNTLLLHENDKQPKYQDLANKCAVILAKKYVYADTYYIDEGEIEDVENFYKERFSKNEQNTDQETIEKTST